MKLLIRNLARTTTEAELRAMFEAHGTVQSCTLVTDKETGSSKGFGFIEMPRPGDAKAAMKTLNGKEVAGNKIRVKKAAPKQAENVGVGSDTPRSVPAIFAVKPDRKGYCVCSGVKIDTGGNHPNASAERQITLVAA